MYAGSLIIPGYFPTVTCYGSFVVVTRLFASAPKPCAPDALWNGLEERPNFVIGQASSGSWIPRHRCSGAAKALQGRSGRRGNASCLVQRSHTERRHICKLQIDKLILRSFTGVALYILTKQLQTKFTWTSGQDSDSIPFDPAETISNQVKTSINSSLHAFRPQEAESSTANSYIDCLLLHFPLPTLEQTLEAWTTLEEFFPHKIRSLGICNTSLLVLQVLYKVEAITVKPSVVQNRFQKSNGYDLGLRRYCREKGIIYQTFGVLKSNPELLDSNVVTEIAALYAESKQATLYQLMLGLGGVAVLNGTTDQTRMDEDIKAVMRQQQQLLGDSDRKSNWLSALMRFQAMVGV